MPDDSPAALPDEPDAAAASDETQDSAPDEGGGPPDRSRLLAKVKLLESQLEESFKRGRDTGERLKETHERLLRTSAEFDNFKKRAQKDREDAKKFGTESLLRDFLPVMDNLERALDLADQHDLLQVIEGVRLVQKLFESTLSRHGVIGFSAVGKPFDPAAQRPNSSRSVPSSSSSFNRSRTVSRLLACCASVALAPPPSRIVSSSVRRAPSSVSNAFRFAANRAALKSSFVVRPLSNSSAITPSMKNVSA